jgi:hypothetical protein
MRHHAQLRMCAIIFAILFLLCLAIHAIGEPPDGGAATDAVGIKTVVIVEQRASVHAPDINSLPAPDPGMQKYLKMRLCETGGITEDGVQVCTPQTDKER